MLNSPDGFFVWLGVFLVVFGLVFFCHMKVSQRFFNQCELLASMMLCDRIPQHYCEVYKEVPPFVLKLATKEFLSS